LRLQLTEFASTASLANVSQEAQCSTVVEIAYEQLCSFSNNAETRDQIKRTQQGIQTTLPPNCGKRSREHTPPKVLSPTKKTKIAEQEAKEAVKVEVKNAS
jgi:hypothetical protein